MKKDIKEIRDTAINAAVIFMSIVLVCVGIKLSVDIGKLLELNREYGMNKKLAVGDSEYVVDTLTEIQGLFETSGLKKDINYDEAAENAIAFYVYSTGDKYAHYESPTIALERDKTDNGDGSGFGVSVAWHDGIGLYIYNVFKNSSADKAGLQNGDYIIASDNKEFKDMEYVDAIKSLKSENGETKKLTILHGDETFDVELESKPYILTPVKSKVIDDKAYIKVEQFTNVCYQDFVDTMNDFKNQGFEDYIIDLRNNPGGHLETVVNMLDYMIGEGTIVSIENKNGEVTQSFTSDSKEFNGNIVVLINENTASASELFSKTLQEYNKAKVVGVKSYGKGTVVSSYTLSNGGNVTISTGLYRTSTGDCIEEVGVNPDYKVELSEEKLKYFYELTIEEDDQLQKGIEVLNSL